MSRRRVLTIWLLSVTLSFTIFIAGCVWAASWTLNGLGRVSRTLSTTPGADLSLGSALPPPPPPSEYGTKHEIGTRGDNPNPRALFHGAFPSDDQTQERHVGGLPARFSGYTTWVRSVSRVPARTYVDGYPGDYLRVKVTVFNRDTRTQHACACDFSVWTRTAGFREADVVEAPTLAPDTMMRSGARLDGNVYLYVGTVPGPYFIVYNPDAYVLGGGLARGVWRAPT